MNDIRTNAASIVQINKSKILDQWHQQLILNTKSLVESIGLNVMKQRTEELLEALIDALGRDDDFKSDSYDNVRNQMTDISRQMTLSNLSSSEAAQFVFSLKNVIFPLFQANVDVKQLAAYYLVMNSLIDNLGLFTVTVYQESREELKREHQRAFMEVSVPVVRIWDRIIMIPLVGMLDSSRAQQMMEIMLTALEDYQSKVVILDISGIPEVDTLVARHLITAASAVRLMGADCVITGIRAKISQTLAQLGVDLSGFITCTTLADGLQLALKMTDLQVGRTERG
jgi:rsbT co-antagonist protein RsbR